MGNKTVELTVYGAKQICASCVGAPGSEDTYDWIQAAVGRKYEDDQIEYKYIDMDNPPNVEKHKAFVNRIIEEDLFYPIILVNDEIAAEGVIKLKDVYKALDEQGVPLKG